LGELLALQWKYVDFQSRLLKVAHSLWKKQLVAPKTVASVRTIPLGSVLVSALAAHRNNSLFTNPEDFVFCKQDGTPLDPDVLRKDVLYPTLDRLNIPRPKGTAGFHAFRHSAASLIHAETGNLKLTQKFLGHSNISTTADIYTHTSEAMEREVATVLEKSILGNLFPIVPNFETGNKNSVN
jgi:integrase